jgi:hypothetical protein
MSIEPQQDGAGPQPVGTDQAWPAQGSSALVRPVTVAGVGAVTHGGLLLVLARGSAEELRRLLTPQR